MGINGRWEVVTLLTADGPTPVIEGTNLTLEIDDDGSIAGFGGCNRFFGRLSESGGLEPLGRTQMAGPPEVIAQEDLYLSLLARADGMAESDPCLEVHADGSPLVVLASSDSDFRHVTWSLMGMHDGAGAFSSVLGDAVINALFDDQDRVSGGSGCKQYTAAYTFSEEGLSIGAPAGTRMMCPDPVMMEQESRYLGWLPRGGFLPDVGGAFREDARPPRQRGDEDPPVRQGGVRREP